MGNIPHNLLMMSTKKNIFYNTILSVSQLLLPLVTYPYVSRVLGPSALGKISFIDSISQYFVLFAAIGIPVYGIREFGKLDCNDKKGRDKLFFELFLLHQFFSFFLICFYILLFFILKGSDLDPYLYLIGGVMILINPLLIEWYYQSKGKFDFITKRSIITKVISAILIFLIIKKQDDFIIYYAILLFSLMMNVLVNLYSFIKEKPIFSYGNLDFRKHFRPLLLLTTTTVVGSIYIVLDTFILGLVGDFVAVGYYSTAIKIVKLPLAMINAVAIVSLSKVSGAFFNNDLLAVRTYLAKSLQYVLTLSIPLSFGMGLTAKWTIPLISGAEFLPAVTAVKILSPVIVLIALNYLIFVQLLTPGHKEKAMLMITIFGSMVSVGSNLFLVPKFSYIGSAITTTVTEFAILLLCVFVSKKEFQINLEIDCLIKALISCILFIPFFYLIDMIECKDFLKILICFFACGLSYFFIQRFAFKNVIVLGVEEFCLNFFKNKI